MQYVWRKGLIAAGAWLTLTIPSPAAEPAATPKPGPVTAATPPNGEQKASQEVEKEERRRLETADTTIRDSIDTQELVKALQVLRTQYPRSRPLLLQTLKEGAPAARCFAVNVLGDYGNVKDDLSIVAERLNDEDATVRRTAAMAVRKFGKEGFPELSAYLKSEPLANNRKLAVNTIKDWHDREHVPFLVAMLGAEKDPAVKKFLVVALEGITGERLGSNPESWAHWLENQSLQEQSLKLVEEKERLAKKKNPGSKKGEK